MHTHSLALALAHNTRRYVDAHTHTQHSPSPSLSPRARRYVESQMRALETQKMLLAKLRGELPETLASQRIKAAEICYELAEHYLNQRKFEDVSGGLSRGLNASQ